MFLWCALVVFLLTGFDCGLCVNLIDLNARLEDSFFCWLLALPRAALPANRIK